jgi:ribosomal protein S18 acetylase RimI-like enzyme
VAVVLRPATEADHGFFARLFASTRAAELAAIPWDDAMKTTLLQQQFAAQSAFYAEHFADGDVSLIEVDGAPVGRLYVVRAEDDIRLVDIGLLPEHRGRGIGRQLLSELAAEADERQRTVSLQVERSNPARRLYERLGFEQVADDGVYVAMRRQPKTAA